jgi:glycosidase
MDVAAHDYFPLDFHLSARSRWEYGVDEALDEAMKDSEAPRIFAARLIASRLGKVSEGKRPVYASEIAAMGLLSEIFRYVFESYCTDEQPSAVDRCLESIGSEWSDSALRAFFDHFPPDVVARKKASAEKVWEEGVIGRAVFARELALLYIFLENPALDSYKPLFDDTELQHAGPSLPFMEKMEAFFSAQPPLKGLGMKLFDALRAPIKASPYNLEGQLQYIMENWSDFLPPRLKRHLLLNIGLVREEVMSRGQVFSESTEALSFGALKHEAYPEPERYSEDADWMSDLVLLAKNVYVWLDQLSKKYRRSITRLDEIPDEELSCLSRWGITGLWLIGLWKRSSASKKIKQMMGNPEAVSSAYSLFDYVICDDLGGERALDSLAKRARKYGIRMASDMVPNHVGLYSRWVIEHPDWFIQLDHPPFPDYQFSGPDLSEDPSVSLFIEDGYWNHSDAAVVFKRVDNRTGSIRYIYHGNDGTHMPWNDTAQLNYLNREVCEAVIQTILHVARHFPIIRFDAAMTLAKKHYHRLWFPGPGEGGAIPSRSEQGLTRDEFDEAMPREFWSEVVDRSAAEVPDTLLLAEAFWLMEGYFVRTLGMHRVYNSAFMNMLKMEDNANYRTTIKNVLEFSPEILKRFVNFMNNPDERTAVEQFGKGDKYFGVAVMLATMPGLPMLGHGQIEGYAEKYGMEYRRAYWDEAVDEGLLKHHESQIFPLLKKRSLFSGSENFTLFDCYTPDGWVDENVFAYSNRSGRDKALVVYNNSCNPTRGWVRLSTSINTGQTDFIQRSLSEALCVSAEPNVFYIFRDHRDGLYYLRRGADIAERGLFFELQGYQYYVLLEWQEELDMDGSLPELDSHLGGRGVADIKAARRELFLQPLLASFRALFTAAVNEEKPLVKRLREPLKHLFESMKLYDLPVADSKSIVTGIESDSRFMICLNLARRLTPLFQKKKELPSQWIEEWLLAPTLRDTLRQIDDSANPALLFQAALDASEVLAQDEEPSLKQWEKLMTGGPAAQFLEVNSHEGVLWFSKERWEELLQHSLSDKKKIKNLKAAAEKAGYCVDKVKILA